MSRHIQPMPSGADCHFMIRSYGDQELPGPEPPSRSPSPDLPPNFVPEAPKDSSHFPACSNIINMIERMSGGIRASEQMIVPAHIWDRNNTHWEHKMIQLRKKHRKELEGKEAEICRRYDQMYSDSRYREQLLAKEMKELEFTQGVTGGGTIYGKSWKEHKAAKKDMEERYIEKIEKIKNELAESQGTVELLRKTLAEKQTAIEALEKAIGKRNDQAPEPVPEQSIQPMQIIQTHQPVQVQQPQHLQQLQQLQPQYYPQQGSGTLGPPLHDPLQLAQAIFQQAASLPYAQQHQQHQQRGAENSMTLYGGNSSLIVPPQITRPAPFSSANIPVFNTGPYNHGQFQGISYQNDTLNPQGNDRMPGINEHSHEKSSQLALALPAHKITPGWNLPVFAPQAPQTDIEMTTNQPPPLSDVGPRPSYGLSGPFGAQKQGLTNTRPAFSQAATSPFSRPDTTNEKEYPHQTSKSPVEAAPDLRSRVLEVPRRHLPPPKALGAEKAGNQKRPYPASSHTNTQGRSDLQEKDLPSFEQIDSSDEDNDGEANAFPKKRKYQKNKSTTLIPFRSSGRTPSGFPAAGSSNTAQPTQKNVSITQKRVDKDAPNTQASRPRKIVQGVGIQDAEGVPVCTDSPSNSERTNSVSTFVQAAKERDRIIVITLKQGLGWTGPEYIISKVRGGQLQSITVVEKEHKVVITFISADAAQTFFDFFNKEPDASQADSRFKMDVKWSHSARLEIPPKLAEAIESGATRCLKVFRISKDKRPEDVKMELDPSKEPWNITNFLIVDDTSERNGKREVTKTATIDFSSIELAIKVKKRIERGSLAGYDNCDVEYSGDPSAIKDGKPCSMDYYRTW